MSSTMMPPSTTRSREKSRSLRPPPNTPLETTFSFHSNPFKSTLPAFVRSPSRQEDEIEYTLTAYGTLVESSEAYAPIPVPPPSNCPKTPLTSSPKRTSNGCLQLRAPIHRPKLPRSNTYSGFSANVGYCRLVIGSANSPCPSPVTSHTTYPGFLRSSGESSSPSPYLAVPKSSSSTSSSPPSPAPPSPRPLPVPIRSQTYPKMKHFAHQHSDSDTDVESDADSSDTCAGSDILDSDDESWLKTNLPRCVSMQDVLNAPDKALKRESPLLLVQLNGHPMAPAGWHEA
ncbi:hypothetical protein FIBSPDRAFT_962899 [Athelia psychrophila]|uniref:Uncharacterized protein n=1 Tax=Athelia psychrophila TaxID=1759441 RepID=A0A165ZL78_9AGAM|nr:hypothetical protein FIBSPDRAFT_962899 [Fibularhizoctonia sp. CBS 109695]